MMRGEVVGQAPLITARPLDANAPSVKLWQAIDAADKQIGAQTGTPLLDPTPRRVLNLYLTTGATAKQLIPVAKVGSDDGVRYQLVSSLEKVFPHLPQELQQEYETPKKALRARSSKLRYSEEHIATLSRKATERWRRYREVEKPQGKSAFSEQGLANIRSRSGRRRRTPGQQ